MCRELVALGVTEVTDGSRSARFGKPGQPAPAKVPGPMRKATPAELAAELERRNAKELSRV